jgi:serine/threonine-protein kinase
MASEHSTSQAQGLSAISAGKTFGGYRIAEAQGSDSAGAVYLAEPQSGGDKVTLRIFAADLSRDKNLAARLVADLQKACAVSHPNLVPVRDIGTADWKGKRYLYIATQRLSGETLERRLSRQGGQPLSLHETLHITSEVGAALAAIHRNNGVHRQVSPSSVFLSRDSAAGAEGSSHAEKVYLLDLGHALLPTSEGQSNQAASKSSKGGKPQEDIRGLAQLVEEMLGGVGEYAESGQKALLPLRFRNPKVPARMDAVLRTVLGDSLGPAEKNGPYATVASFFAALIGTGDTQPTLGAWSEDGRTVPRPRSSSSFGLAWAALFAVLAAAGIAYWLTSQGPPPTPPPSLDMAQASPAPPQPAAAPDGKTANAPQELGSVVNTAVDAGVQAARPVAWPTRSGVIPPLRDANPEPPAKSPAAKPPAPSQSPGATTAAPGPSGQKEVK